MIELTKENKSLFYDASGLDLQTLIDLVNRKNKNIFTLDNFIDDRELNELGVQVYRALAYDQRFDELRRNSALFNSDRHKELKKNGFLKIENFLNTEEFTIIQIFEKLHTWYLENIVKTHANIIIILTNSIQTIKSGFTRLT